MESLQRREKYWQWRRFTTTRAEEAGSSVEHSLMKLPPKHFLGVEDESGVREACRLLLRMEGHTVSLSRLPAKAPSEDGGQGRGGRTSFQRPKGFPYASSNPHS